MNPIKLATDSQSQIQDVQDIARILIFWEVMTRSKAARENSYIKSRNTKMKITAGFSSETTQANRQSRANSHSRV